MDNLDILFCICLINLIINSFVLLVLIIQSFDYDRINDKLNRILKKMRCKK